MKNILVLSDTHGNTGIYDKIMPQIVEADYIFHLGDMLSDGMALKKRFGNKVVLCRGNCDGCFSLDEQIVEIEGARVLATHGNYFSVKSGTYGLYEHAKSAGAKLVLFGHTHEAAMTVSDGITLLNPGTLSQYASERSYGYATIVSGKVFAKTVVIG